MDLFKGDVRTIYRKYFSAAFGSALILLPPATLGPASIWRALPSC